ncbi:restriction endonuclease subunit S [Clostridium perfringens]
MSFKETELGKIPTEWKVIKVSEYTHTVTDYVANGSFASLKNNVQYYEEPNYAVLLRLTDYNNNYNGNFIFIDKKAYEFLNKTKLYGGEIIISNVGANVGTVFKVPILEYKMNLAPNSIMVKTKGEDDFYYYWFKSRNGQQSIKSILSGSAQPKFNKTSFKNLYLPVPPLEEQKAIAKILSDLDEKIEVNNKINKNLEEMAQAIFKQWFVDFEFPNEEGKPYKSSGGEMVESELGMIPSDFSIINLNQLGKIITGKTPSTKNLENFGDEYMFITPKDVKGDMYVTNTERLLSEKGTEKLKNNKIQPNSIGVTCIGSNLGEVYINSKYIFTNQQINSLVLNEDRTYPYVYILLKNMKEEFLNIASGSAVPIINKSTFSNLKVILPNKNILNRFNEIMISNFEIIRNNLDENEILEKLRDTLLPKLMSGEIRVPLENSEN